MERHRCKICYRKFANGRALGGHMRSHMMNLPIVPKPSYETESWAELSPSSSSSSSSDEDDDQEELGEIEKGLAYKLRENPKKSMKFTDHNNVEFSSFGSSSVSVTKDLERETEFEFESESESESSKQRSNPTKKRSKRQRNSKPPPIETTSSMSPASSVSEVTSEEDVALCLMMLSRDDWKCSAPKKDDRFTCLTCNKVFRSYQALGGHRASHKKIRPENHPQLESEPGPGSGSDPNKQKKTHECPVCFRVFASAQALGGHKRTHSSTTSAAVGGGGSGSGSVRGAAESNGVHHESPKKKMNAFIDLNLPAPVDDHDDEISQVSLSAVSDPRFS